MQFHSSADDNACIVLGGCVVGLEAFGFPAGSITQTDHRLIVQGPNALHGPSDTIDFDPTTIQTPAVLLGTLTSAVRSVASAWSDNEILANCCSELFTLIDTPVDTVDFVMSDNGMAWTTQDGALFPINRVSFLSALVAALRHHGTLTTIATRRDAANEADETMGVTTTTDETMGVTTTPDETMGVITTPDETMVVTTTTPAQTRPVKRVKQVRFALPE
jgi:hypothetical protein